MVLSGGGSGGGSTPAESPITILKIADENFDETTIEREWTGELTRNMIKSVGVNQGEAQENIISPTELYIGTGITSIAAHCFDNYDVLDIVTIPSTVTSIGAGVFDYIGGMDSITINKTRAAVQGMDNYPFGLDTNGGTIHCLDGDLTVEMM